MEYVTLRTDFADRDEFRLLAMDADWVKQLRVKMEVHSRGPCTQMTTSGGTQLRQHMDALDREETVLVMKGQDQLVACDTDHGFRLRRVEYSNTLLVAEEHLMCERDIVACKKILSTDYDSSTGIKEMKKQVVICAAGRLFEAKRARSYRDVIHLLRACPITMSELEDDEKDGDNDTNNHHLAHPELRIDVDDDVTATIQKRPRTEKGKKLYTFPHLVAISRSSARALADTLAEEGAVVHRGKVRLLHPLLLSEALQAVLFFLEASDEISWEAVKLHFCPSVYPPVIIKALQAMYGRSERADSDKAAAMLLHPGKVVRALAAAVFAESANAEKVNLGGSLSFPLLNFEHFYDAWVNKIPASFFVSGRIAPRSEKEALLAFLHGFTVICKMRGDSYDGATILWAPHDSLDDEMSRRVEQLFELNPGRWGAETLRAYLEPLLDPGVAFDHAVQRYVKEFRVPNQPLTYGKLA